MEHAARLAVIEQNAKTPAAFEQLIDVLLELVEGILESPDEQRYRSVRGTGALAGVLNVAGTPEYLKHVGFVIENGNLTFPSERSLNNLKLAQNAMERKLHLMCGQPRKKTGAKRKVAAAITKQSKPKLTSTTPLRTNNKFLESIQFWFDQVLKYEDEETLELARRCVPLVTLQLRAVEALRGQQRSIKQGSGGSEIPLEMGLLAELMSWFKHSFFRWMDKPECVACAAATQYVRSSSVNTGGEICRVELYQCPRCSEPARFVRYNDPRQLLRSREGRCGEWANCFALLCRALGYDTRFVVDSTDHVWCEVYDSVERRWVHVDPCENSLDTPLMYEHGWDKKLEYVIAYSRDDVQDVTWRYSSRHREVRARRRRCGEAELVTALLSLRAARQAPLSDARRAHLLQRSVRELVELMVEKQPSDYESKGRISGSEEWRKQRGEYGSENKRTWTFDEPGEHTVEYYPEEDVYTVSAEGRQGSQQEWGWQAGTWSYENIQRKVEHDWKMVYLARTEGGAAGRVTWRVAARAGLRVARVTLAQVSCVFHDARVDWSACVDDRPPEPLQFEDCEKEWRRAGVRGGGAVEVRAELAGGGGERAWQHAQLFRRPLGARACALRLIVTVTADTPS